MHNHAKFQVFPKCQSNTRSPLYTFTCSLDKVCSWIIAHQGNGERPSNGDRVRYNLQHIYIYINISLKKKPHIPRVVGDVGQSTATIYFYSHLCAQFNFATWNRARCQADDIYIACRINVNICVWSRWTASSCSLTSKYLCWPQHETVPRIVLYTV